MKHAVNHLHTALDALSTHRELIGEVYDRGSVLRTAENARDVFVLQKLRILITDGHDSFRLSRHLTRFLDDLTQKQRLYELLGDDIGKLNDRVHKLRDEYVVHFMAGNVDDADSVAGDFHDACAELSDAVSSSIARLLLQAENDFAAVRTLAAKERQNRHYLDQAETLSKALGSLERMNMQDLLDSGSASYTALADPYRRLVTLRLNEWNTELNRVTGILKAYLFKIRQIAPDVRRLRAFARFLHQNPGYTMPDFEDRRVVPTWLLRDPGLRVTAHVEIGNDAISPELEAIARKLPAPRVTIRTPREAGSLAKRANDKQPLKISQPLHRVALQRLGHAALKSGAPISALSWKREHASDISVPDDIWLLLVLHSRDIDRTPFRRLAYQVVGHSGSAAISKNRFINDILLHGR
jgi:hypothetical protein